MNSIYVPYPTRSLVASSLRAIAGLVCGLGYEEDVDHESHPSHALQEATIEIQTGARVQKRFIYCLSLKAITISTKTVTQKAT